MIYIFYYVIMFFVWKWAFYRFSRFRAKNTQNNEKIIFLYCFSSPRAVLCMNFDVLVPKKVKNTKYTLLVIFFYLSIYIQAFLCFGTYKSQKCSKYMFLMIKFCFIIKGTFINFRVLVPKTSQNNEKVIVL